MSAINKYSNLVRDLFLCYDYDNGMDIEATIREKFRSLSRVWTSIDDASGPPRKPVRGYGDIAVVARATGISRRAILVGLRESTSGHMLPEGRVRRPGAGANPALRITPTFRKRWRGWSSRSRAVTRSRRCAGLARARDGCPGNWPHSGMPQAADWWERCCMEWAIASRGIARRLKTSSIRN